MSGVGYEPKGTLSAFGFQGDAMSEEAASEKTPESNGLKAIEDAGPKDGLMRPCGPPVVLGPNTYNPFWSERMQEEAVLRALRPAAIRGDGAAA